MNPRALVLLLTLAYNGAQAEERGGIFGTLKGWVRAIPGLGGKKAEETPQKIMTRIRVTPFTGGQCGVGLAERTARLA